MRNTERGHGRTLMKLARSKGIVRAAEATAMGIPRVYLRRLVQEGKLEQVARGLYRPADKQEASAHHGLALVALKSPQAVVSLLSALSFHGLTTQLPPEVWITLPSKARVPHLDWPPIRVVRASGPALTSGIEHRTIEGVAVKVYSPAKTVADCFKFRNKIGLDVALEALRAYRLERKGTMNELERMARISRVSRIMRPYVEALSS